MKKTAQTPELLITILLSKISAYAAHVKCAVIVFIIFHFPPNCTIATENFFLDTLKIMGIPLFGSVFLPLGIPPTGAGGLHDPMLI